MILRVVVTVVSYSMSGFGGPGVLVQPRLAGGSVLLHDIVKVTVSNNVHSDITAYTYHSTSSELVWRRRWKVYASERVLSTLTKRMLSPASGAQGPSPENMVHVTRAGRNEANGSGKYFDVEYALQDATGWK